VIDLKGFYKFVLITIFIVICQYILQNFALDYSYYIDLFSMILFFHIFSGKNSYLIYLEAFLIGLIMDSLSFSPIGLNITSYLIISFLAIKMIENFVFSRLRDKMLIMISALYLKSILDFILIKFFEYSIILPILKYLIIRPIATSIIFYILVYFFIVPDFTKTSSEKDKYA